MGTGRKKKLPEDVWEAILSLSEEKGGHQSWQQEDQRSRRLSRSEHCLLFPERLLCEPRVFKGGGIVESVIVNEGQVEN